MTNKNKVNTVGGLFTYLEGHEGKHILTYIETKSVSLIENEENGFATLKRTGSNTEHAIVTPYETPTSSESDRKFHKIFISD